MCCWMGLHMGHPIVSKRLDLGVAYLRHFKPQNVFDNIAQDFQYLAL